MVNLIWRRGRAIMVFEVWWFVIIITLVNMKEKISDIFWCRKHVFVSFH